MTESQEPAASPIDASFAPMRCYAEACAAAQQGMLSFAQAAQSLTQSFTTLALQQAQLMRGMNEAVLSSWSALQKGSSLGDLVRAEFEAVEQQVETGLKAAQAFDADPRWTRAGEADGPRATA